MAGINEAIFKVVADTRDATQSLNNFKNVVISAGAAFAGFFLTSKFEDAAAEQEESINKLNIALKSTGQFSQEASDELQAFASALQKTTKFSDDQILGAQALLQTIGHLSKDGLKEATTAALDLSTAYGIDLDTASRMIGKGAEGNIQSFKKLGIEIKAGANDAETFANMIRAIPTGAAAASVNTFAGAVAQMNNGWNEVEESLGGFIIKNPAVLELIKQTTSVFFGLSEELSKSSLGFTIVTSSVNAMVLTVAVATDILKDMHGGANGITTALGNVGRASQAVIPILAELLSGKFDKLELISDSLNAQAQIEINKNAETQNSYDNVLSKLTSVQAAIQVAGDKEIVDSANRRNSVMQDEEIKKQSVLDAYLATVEGKNAILIQEQELISTTEFDSLSARYGEQFALATAHEQALLQVKKTAAAEQERIGKESADKQNKFAKFQTDFDAFMKKEQVQNTMSSLQAIQGLTASSNITLFRLGQAAGIANAIVNTAGGVVHALNTPFPLDIILPPLVAAAGAVQIATIASQKPPTAKDGIDFIPQSEDNFTFLASRGERVVGARLNEDLTNFLTQQKESPESNSGGITFNISVTGQIGDSDLTSQAIAKSVTNAFEYLNVSRGGTVAA